MLDVEEDVVFWISSVRSCCNSRRAWASIRVALGGDCTILGRGVGRSIGRSSDLPSFLDGGFGITGGPTGINIDFTADCIEASV